MTETIDLRGSGELAKEGFEEWRERPDTPLGRILQLFETGHRELAVDLLRNKNNSEPTCESMEIVIDWRDYFSKVEIRKWFIDMELEDRELGGDLLAFKFNQFLGWDSEISAKTGFEMHLSGILNDNQKMDLSEVLIRIGSLEKAISVIKSIENEDYRVDAIKLAKIATKGMKKIEDQAEAWNKIMKNFTLDDDDLMNAASKMYSAGRHSDVIDLLTKKIHNNPNKKIGLLLARSYFTEMDYDSCLNVCRSILMLHPDDHDILKLIIRSKKRQGVTGDQEIFQALNRSLEIGAIHPKDASHLASLFIADRKWEQASRALDAAFSDKEYKINDSQIILKSRILSGLKGDREARDWLLSNDHENSVALTKTLASVLHRLREDKGALEARRKVLEFDSKDIGTRRGICISLLRLKRLEEAVSESKTITEILPTDAGAWEILIETLLKMGRGEDAFNAWNDILKMSENNDSGLFLAIDICVRFNWEKRLDEILSSKLHGNKPNGIGTEILDMMMQRGRFDLARTYEKLLGPPSTESLKIVSSLEAVLCVPPNSILENARKNGTQTETVILEHLIRNKTKMKGASYNGRSAIILTGSLNAGGAEKQVLLTGAGLRDEGWDITIGVDRIDAQNSGETLRNLAESLDLNCVEFRDSCLDSEEADELINRYSDILNYLKPIERVRSECIIKMIVNLRPRIIHAWQDAMIVPAAIAGYISGLNSIVGSVRSLNPDEKSFLHGRKRPFIKKSLQMLCHQEDFILLNNSQAGRESYARWLELPDNDIGLVRNGILKNRNGRIDLRKILNLPVESNLIGGVFRLVPEKRPLLWVDSVWACIKGREKTFGVIIGDGSMRQEVENRIQEIGAQGRIILHGFREDVYSCYDSFNVTVLTSSTEGLPNVLIESQARGVPVVSTNVGGVRESMANRSTGILVESDDVNLIKSALDEILDKWNLEAVKEVCQAFVDQAFGLERMAKETENVYESLLL